MSTNYSLPSGATVTLKDAEEIDGADERFVRKSQLKSAALRNSRPTDTATTDAVSVAANLDAWADVIAEAILSEDELKIATTIVSWAIPYLPDAAAPSRTEHSTLWLLRLADSDALEKLVTDTWAAAEVSFAPKIVEGQIDPKAPSGSSTSTSELAPVG